jgi:hypothetical protein
MSVTSIGSSDSQSIGSLVLQSLLSSNSNSADSNGLSGILGDLMSLSPASTQLAKAPAEVTQAMNDLFSSQADVPGDLTKLKSYFQDNPQTLASVLGTLQGKGTTYSPSGALGSNPALLSALAKAQAGGTDTSGLVQYLMGGASSDPLLASLCDASDSSGTMSMFG